MKPYGQRVVELKWQQVEERQALFRRQSNAMLELETIDLTRLAGARDILCSASGLNAPRAVIDALCRWIGDLEKAARNAGLLTEESC